MTAGQAGYPAASGAAENAAEYADRMRRAVGSAASAGLAGVLVGPGPDLTWLTGYRPGITERLTLLVLTPGRPATLVVPALERPDAAESPGASALTLLPWSDGDDPYQAVAPLLRPDGRYGIAVRSRA